MKKFGKKVLSSELRDVSSHIVLLLTRDENPQGWRPRQPTPFCSHALQQGSWTLCRWPFFSVFLCLVPNPGLGYWRRLIFCADKPFVITLKSFPADRNLERWSEFDTFSFFLDSSSAYPIMFIRDFQHSARLWHKIFLKWISLRWWEGLIFTCNSPGVSWNSSVFLLAQMLR